MIDPRQTMATATVVVSGYDGIHDLQFSAGVANGQEIETGAIVSLDSNGDFVNGLPVLHAIPMICVRGSKNLDVSTGYSLDHNMSGGAALAYPVTGGYEFKTTRWKAGETFAVNTPVAPGTGADAGLAIEGAVPMAVGSAHVGITSRAMAEEAYGNTMLHFIGAYIPNRA